MKYLSTILLIFGYFGVFSQNTNYGTNAGNSGSGNISIGYFAGDVTSGKNNSFLGHYAGANSTRTTFNTFVGAYSGFKAQGNNQTFSGAYAGNVSEGNDNSFYGAHAGFKNTGGSYNTYSGARSGYTNEKGNFNTFTGYLSGYNNTVSSNTFYGSLSGYSNTIGERNTFVGDSAGYSNTHNSDNVFVGYKAGKSSVGIGHNTFVGSRAGENATVGYANTLIGEQAGGDLASGIWNTHVGMLAGGHSAAGTSYNTFVGMHAGRNSNGNDNTFIGTSAGADGYQGKENVLIGRFTGYTTRGDRNTISGAYAGYSTGMSGTGGDDNVFMGYDAGRSNNAGSSNIYLGARAGFSNVAGSGNVFIGHNAGETVSASNKLYIHNSNDAIPLIYGDFTTKNVGLGTTTPGTYRLYVNGDAYATGLWVSSDERFKKKSSEIKSALDKIRSTKGRSYEFKDNADLRQKHFKKGTHFGFFAQELQKAIPELVNEDEDGYLAVNYVEMIPILTEAIKELDSKQALLDAQTMEMSELSDRLLALEHSLSFGGDANHQTDGGLGLISEIQLQNIPNPAKNETTIQYSTPAQASQAQIMIFDLQGRVVKTFDHVAVGKGELNVSTGEIGTGMFNYALIADDKIVKTGKMILR